MEESFAKVKFVIGKIISAVPFEKARKPAYQLVLDFGAEIGKRQSSAQLTQGYPDPSQLVGNLAVAVLNFPRRLVAGFRSEVLVLGFYADETAVKLMQPEDCNEELIGKRIGLVKSNAFALSSEEAETSYDVFSSLNIHIGIVEEVKDEILMVNCQELGIIKCPNNKCLSVHQGQWLTVLAHDGIGHVLAAGLNDTLLTLTTDSIVPVGSKLF